MTNDFIFKLPILVCVLAVAAAPVTAAAQAAPAVQAAPAGQAARAAEPVVGRLFFTPAQRASLDVARTQRARNTLANEKTVDESTPVAQTITYGGMVRRTDGKSTVWINGQPVNDHDPAGGVSLVGRVRPDGSVSLQAPQSGRSIDLKPGQSVELLSGVIEESYLRLPPQTESKPAAKPAAEATSSAKPAPPDRTAEDRSREEREQQRIEDAVTRALRETASAKSGGTTVAPATQPAR